MELKGLSDWTPNHDHLRVLGIEMIRLAQADTHIERLCVSKDLALEMFEDNVFKSSQIPSIAQKNEGNHSNIVDIFYVYKTIDIV